MCEGSADGGGKLQGPIDHHLIWYLENQEVAWNFFQGKRGNPGYIMYAVF